MGRIIGCNTRLGDTTAIKQSLAISGSDAKLDQPICVYFEEFHCAFSRRSIFQDIHYLHSSQLHFWFHGKIYNQPSQENRNEITIMFEKSQGPDFEIYLSELDAVYHCIIYDDLRKTITFITDRFGFKPLYIYQKGSDFAWASELKLFKNLHHFQSNINKEAIDAFLLTGQLLENQSWFSNVELIPAASVMTFNLTTKECQNKKYWHWEQINKISISFDDAVQRSNEFFQHAVRSRIDTKRTGILLSGGLDSRAILAATIQEKPKFIFGFSYGSEKSDELKFAQEACRIAKCKQETMDLDKEFWLPQRMADIWKTDGLTSLIHLHFAGMHDKIKVLGKNYLSGFAGDLVFRGSWLNNPQSFDIIHYAKNELGVPDNTIIHPIHGTDPYFIDSRVRRFTLQGILELDEVDIGMPFFAIPLIEFLYSLPDHYRLNGQLYKSMLNNFYPLFYRNIPDANSGMLIEKYDWKNYLFYLRRKIQPYKKYAINYKDLSFQNREKILNLVDYKESLLSALISFDVHQKIRELFENLTEANMLLLYRYVTLEIWLNQFYESRFIV